MILKGDEPGKAGGIKSGTCGKKVETKTASKNYFANGTATVQVGCEVWMNDRNTVGKIYERGTALPPISSGNRRPYEGSGF